MQRICHFLLGDLPFVIESLRIQAIKSPMTNSHSQMTNSVHAELAVVPGRPNLHTSNGRKYVSVFMKSTTSVRYRRMEDFPT